MEKCHDDVEMHNNAGEESATEATSLTYYSLWHECQARQMRANLNSPVLIVTRSRRTYDKDKNCSSYVSCMREGS